MLPNTPEIIVIFVICVAIFGLGKLDELGELAWRLRCALSPSLGRENDERRTDGADADRNAPDA